MELLDKWNKKGSKFSQFSAHQLWTTERLGQEACQQGDQTTQRQNLGDFSAERLEIFETVCPSKIC